MRDMMDRRGMREFEVCEGAELTSRGLQRFVTDHESGE